MRICTLRKAYELAVGMTLLLEHHGQMRPTRILDVTPLPTDDVVIECVVVQVDNGESVKLIADGDVIVLEDPVAWERAPRFTATDASVPAAAR